ncbi:MAG: DUF2802 domain-containing protein [Methylophilaceae bacterium]|nr:DUF2802 domain-containing protein [Methylophilaceae bacterium]
MSGHIVITWRELLLLAAIVLAVYVAEMLLFLRASGGLRKPRWLGLIHEKRVEAELRREIEALRERVEKLEARLPLPEQHDNADTPYNRAILLARQGADANQLIAQCGISRGEAELIIAMQKR